MEQTTKKEFTNDQIWQQRVQEMRCSGLSQKEWCKQNGVSVSTLRYWIRKLDSSTTSSALSGWMTLESHPDVFEHDDSDIILHYAGIKMIFTRTADRELSRKLIHMVLRS